MHETGKPIRPRLVLPKGSTVEDLFADLPSDLVEQLRRICDVTTDSDITSDPRITTALDGLGEGVAVVVDKGEIVWMNDRLANHPPEMLRAFSDRCAEAIAEFESHPEVRDGEVIRLGFDFEERSYEVICSPMPNDPERHKVSVLLSDVTELRATERLVDQLDQAGAELLNLDPDIVSALDVGARLRLLEDRVVDTLRDSIGFEHFEVRLLDRKSGQLELVMGSGMQDLPIGERLYALGTDNGITGWVATSGTPYICRDTSSDPLYITGVSNARSSLTVPLRLHEKVVGVLNVESLQTNAFKERDLFVLEIYGRYIAMAMNILDMLVVERYTTSKSFSGTVLGELASPLESITRRVTELQEGTDVPVAEKLEDILNAVEVIRERIRACTTGPQTILGAGDSCTDPIDDPIINGSRILIADDEPSIRDTIATVLQRRGAVVQTCADGSAAIDAIEKACQTDCGFNLVISDVRMPDCNGYEVFRAAKSANESTLVILMTGFGYDPHHSIVRSSQEGLEAFLFKPFQVNQLLVEVHKALRTTAE